MTKLKPEQKKKEQQEKEEIRLAKEFREQKALKEALLTDQEKPHQYQLKPSPEHKEDLDEILKDYKKKYPNIPIDPKKPALQFDTREDAINFFTAQATSKPPRKFLAIEVDDQGKPTGFYCYSCGDGTLYQGSLKDIKNALQEAPVSEQTKNGLDFIKSYMSNPTQNFRANMQNQKNEESAKKDEPESSLPGSPSPLNTQPKL